MKSIVATASILAALVGGLAIAQASGDKKVKMQDLPAAVQQAVKTHSQGATVRGFSMEVEGGKNLYEAELFVNGHTKDITFDEQGNVVAAEEETSLDKIPPAAAAAIQRGAADGKINVVEAVTENGKTSYEAQIVKGKKRSEIRVDGDGQPVR